MMSDVVPKWRVTQRWVRFVFGAYADKAYQETNWIPIAREGLKQDHLKYPLKLNMYDELANDYWDIIESWIACPDEFEGINHHIDMIRIFWHMMQDFDKTLSAVELDELLAQDESVDHKVAYVQYILNHPDWHAIQAHAHKIYNAYEQTFKRYENTDN